MTLPFALRVAVVGAAAAEGQQWKNASWELARKRTEIGITALEYFPCLCLETHGTKKNREKKKVDSASING